MNVAAMLKLRALSADHIHISDISINSCRLRSRWHVPVGSKVRVFLPRLEPWWAIVSWYEGGEGGLEFDRPLHPMVAQRYGLRA